MEAIGLSWWRVDLCARSVSALAETSADDVWSLLGDELRYKMVRKAINY